MALASIHRLVFVVRARQGVLATRLVGLWSLEGHTLRRGRQQAHANEFDWVLAGAGRGSARARRFLKLALGYDVCHACPGQHWLGLLVASHTAHGLLLEELSGDLAPLSHVRLIQRGMAAALFVLFCLQPICTPERGSLSDSLVPAHSLGHRLRRADSATYASRNFVCH